MTKRQSVVNGHFYPNTKEELHEYFNFFNQKSLTCKEFAKIKALIVPHAGYIYSGETANFAYRAASKENFRKVIVLGPSHRVGFEGASISLFDEFETPLGNIEIDLEYAKILQEKFSFLFFHQDCHKEHSTETQMPFIKHYFPNSKVIEIVYGRLNSKHLSHLVDFVLKDEDTLLVVSTDLSHFYTLQKANELDNICIDGIKTQDETKLHKGCEACGKVGISSLLHVSQNHNLQVEVLDYTTSYKQSKDESSVVGYVSAIFGIL